MSNFNYCLLTWHCCGEKNTKKIEKIREAFGKFLAWSYISITDLQTVSCVVSF